MGVGVGALLHITGFDTYIWLGDNVCPMAPKIEVESLRKEFSVPSGIEVAVDGVDIEIGDQEFLTLVGPSGCGKTTTLRCIAGLEQPTSGKILFDGEDVTGTPAHKRNLSMMFQNIALYPHMQVWENIAYPLKLRGVPKDEQYERVKESAEIVRIDDNLLEKAPGDLSGGQRQRVALARTVIQEPFAFLMDEPLSDLDAKLKIEIRKEIQRIHRKFDRPTVYVTHDQEEALTMSDRIAVMNDGKVEQIGTRRELVHYPNNQFVAEFIGNPSMNMFEGVLDGNEFTLAGDSYSFEYDERYDETSTAEVRMGIRPHDIIVERSSDSAIAADLLLLEPVDDRAIATMELDNGDEVAAKIPSENDFEEGERVSIRFDPQGFYFFDIETTELIARANYQDVEEPVPPSS